jgi:hypothetical protein
VADFHLKRIFTESVDSRDQYFARSCIISPMGQFLFCVKGNQGSASVQFAQNHSGGAIRCSFGQ